MISWPEQILTAVLTRFSSFLLTKLELCSQFSLVLLLVLCTPLISGTRRLCRSHLSAFTSPKSRLSREVFPPRLDRWARVWRSGVSMAASHSLTLPSSSSSQTSFLRRAIGFQVDRRAREELKRWRKKERAVGIRDPEPRTQNQREEEKRRSVTAQCWNWFGLCQMFEILELTQRICVWLFPTYWDDTTSAIF